MWKTEIERLGPDTIKVTATRTNGDDVHVYTVEAATDPASLAGTKGRIVSAIWSAYTTDQSQRDSVAAMNTKYAAVLDAALDAKEPS